MSSTKERILTIARELFARQGYTGTTIADIARELGTTTAALYYHFPSKADILRGLLAEPLAAYTRIIEGLESGEISREQLLDAFIDLAVDSQELATVIDRDPAVLAMIDEQLPQSSQEMTERVIAALAEPDADPGAQPGAGAKPSAGPSSDRAAMIRANAAFAVVKGATTAALAANGGKLDAADRAEIIGAAERALRPGG